MAKAAFHKSQKVFVKPVGTWAVVEQVLPQWVKGLDEPLKVHYDVGLGREFSASELVADKSGAPIDDVAVLNNWRINRARNRWKDTEDTTSHPYPGTFPVVTTDEKNWGGAGAFRARNMIAIPNASSSRHGSSSLRRS